jgi:hypothetical protein
MATDEPVDEPPEEMSPEEAREALIRLITRQEIEEHADIYEELARE